MKTSAQLTEDLFHAMGMLNEIGADKRKASKLVAKIEQDRQIAIVRESGKTYKRGDWLLIRHGYGNATRLALVHDISERSPGNYRGSPMAGDKLCHERTILAVEIIGPAPDDSRLRRAKRIVETVYRNQLDAL